MVDKKIFQKGIGGVLFHKSLVRKISHGKKWWELPEFSDIKFKFARFNIFEKNLFRSRLVGRGRLGRKLPRRKGLQWTGRDFVVISACGNGRVC
jgi:hypothetical protein